MSKVVTVVRTKSPMDRQLMEIARQKLIEAAPEVVRFLLRVLTSDETVKEYVRVGRDTVAVDVPAFSTENRLVASRILADKLFPNLAALKVSPVTDNLSGQPQIDWRRILQEELANRPEGAEGNGAVH